MAKSKRKRKQEIRNKKEAQQFWRVVLIATAILLVLLYFIYRQVT